MSEPVKLFLASGNPGKLREFHALAAGRRVEIAPLPKIAQLPAFDESAPTFAENAAGKALHYSRFAPQLVMADDSGLVVDALDGAPGPRSARYAGPAATDADRVKKLLGELRSLPSPNRCARFVCALALAEAGRILAVVSDLAEGTLLDEPRGQGGFGYDPIFFFPLLGKTFAELAPAEKNLHSHRGRAFRKLLAFLEA